MRHGSRVPERMAERIRHAEAWLRRAQVDCQRGHTQRALLRLFLAEAEIRRARESGTFVAAREDSVRRMPARWAVLGAVAAAALLLAARYNVVHPFGFESAAGIPRPVHAAPTAHAPQGILQFESARVLPFVGEPGEAAPDRAAAPVASWV